ncbi:SAM-dependent methyltransferase [Saccharothrix sp. ALI-22-I]|uniref:O-methyltransferase n=1 Tax=Saccharothrix sp. ALI-22-I TaxID=1933778 RepID=UPI00097CB86A|nr:class I SAM-dependent methyltransferase [Saccharothrix sp. ALI-22-I]ONI92125.1 SAM-dependent methyltransferase [Saccharothrix sp. ALI-22-I]
MTDSGTAAYDHCVDLPPLVAKAVGAARSIGFAYSCLPEQGRLLRVLAGGVGAGVIGETGTGCGVGLAWLASGAHPDARLVSVERDRARAETAAGVFADESRVQVRTGDWSELADTAPFDLLVLDGGGQGKGDERPLDPAEWLRPGGLVVLDDFTPMTSWPPVHDGQPDTARMYWLSHPRLRAAEVRVTPTAATIVATFLG